MVERNSATRNSDFRQKTKEKYNMRNAKKKKKQSNFGLMYCEIGMSNPTKDFMYYKCCQNLNESKK